MNPTANPHPDAAPASKQLKSPEMGNKPIRILLVDDEPGILNGVSRLLRSERISIVAAGEGTEALKAFSSEKIDLVISDFNMPGMNGLELLKELKRLDPSVKVIAHCSGLSNENAAALREAGIKDILDKPTDKRTLLAAIDAALAVPFEGQEPLADGITGPAKALVRVLFVDDNEDIRSGMVDVGEILSLDIKAADGGKDAIVQFLKDKPDVVVSDFHMPGMNGLELLNAIKALSPKTPVIILTAEADAGERRALMEAGAFKVLQKPVNLDLFGQTVNDALAE